MKTITEIISILTADEQQIMKDVLVQGFWGSTDYEFLDGNENIIAVPAYGYCVNDAKNAGNFQGRIVSTMFRSIYRKMCPAYKNQIGQHLSHANNWREDGSGDMLFLPLSLVPDFENWARNI